MRKTATLICFCAILFCIGSFFYLQKTNNFKHYFKNNTAPSSVRATNLAKNSLHQSVTTVSDAPDGNHSKTHIKEILPSQLELPASISSPVINQPNYSQRATFNQYPQSNNAHPLTPIPANQSALQNQPHINPSDLNVQNKIPLSLSKETATVQEKIIQTHSSFTVPHDKSSQNTPLNTPSSAHQIYEPTSYTHQSPSVDKSNTPLILTRLEIDASEVLPSFFFSKLRQGYEQEELTIHSIKEIINKINEEYQKNGYLTCKAYVQPQNIQNGVLKISLFEGKTGTLKLNDSPLLRAAYIKTFLNIPEGKVLNVSDLENRILLYNAVNENKMRLSLQPSQKVGHTDIEGVINPLDRFSISLFTDNAGQKETGYYRYGFFSNLKNIIPMDILKDQFNFGGFNQPVQMPFSDPTR